MNRYLKVLSAAVLVCLMATSCATGSSTGSSEESSNPSDPPKFAPGTAMAAIQKRGKLVVGVRPDAAPFSSQDPNTGSWKGFDVGLAKVIAQNIFGEKIEGKVEFVALDALERESALDRGRVDIAMGRYGITIARKRFVDFAGPYYIAKQDVIVGSDSGIDGIALLNKQKICTIIGSTNIDALKAAVPLADLSMQTRDASVCSAALATDSVAAVAGDHVDLLSVMRDGGTSFRALKDSYATEPYGIGVRKNALDLRQWLNDLLDEKIKTVWSQLYREQTQDTSNSTQPTVDRY